MKKRPLIAMATTLAVAAALLTFGGFDPPEPDGGDAGERVETGSAEPSAADDGAEPGVPTPPTPGGSEEEPEMAGDAARYPEPVNLAVETLAASLGMDAAEVSVVKVEPVTWSDGSLGCPQPGMMYTQMLTEGYRVTLDAGDERAIFHTDRHSQVVRCESPAPGGLYESESAPTH